MKIRNYLTAVLCLITLLFCGGAIYAMTSIEVVNHFETGIVDISLKEYKIVDGKEVLWEDSPTILPGDRISKIPRIYNRGCDCYLRARVIFRDAEELDEKNIFGLDSNWILADDGYYYYTEILEKDSQVDFFQGLEIPVDFSQSYEEQRFSMDIVVDAIQSENFKPEFQAADPWGNVEIIACEKEGTNVLQTLISSDRKTFLITYEGESEKLVSNSEDFFANIPVLMPGDEFEDCITFDNTSSEDIKLYFFSVASDENNLPDKILLNITESLEKENHTVYEGTVRTEDLKEGILLGTLSAKSKGCFSFKISVPKELQNQYALSKSHVTWIFSTEPVRNIYAESVQTGDFGNFLGYLCLMAVSGILCCFIGVKSLRGREKNNEKKEFCQKKL